LPSRNPTPSQAQVCKHQAEGKIRSTKTMMNDMRTVVGLFEDRDEAKRALRELKSDKIDAQYIREISNAPESRTTLEALTNDISEPDVRFYQEGVRRGGHLLVVTAPVSDAQRAAAIMARFNTVDVDARSAEYRSRGGDYTLRDYDDQDYVLPVVEEELRVGKREVERGRMRVYSRVIETPVEEQVTLREERVNVERRPVDRPVTDADLAAMQDKTFEVTAKAEEAVVAKRARVIEEVVVRKEAVEHTETIRDTVRRTDVEVERAAGGVANEEARGMAMADYNAFDSDFRSHYDQHFASGGYSYDEYKPVYSYGYSLATDTRYQGRDWADIEADARTTWEQHNPNTWEQFKDSVRYAWDKARGRR
jgi:uncharacterized protein (TIGR02271 family)